MSLAPARPAVVGIENARRLPRVALLLFCAAYVLPGLFGRDPWKNADITAFGFMASLARGDSSWLDPRLGGLAADGGLLPYWVGALAIQALGPVLGAPLAARLPFALMLLGVLALSWYACYHLARTEAAQPVSLPFGGGASPVDYSRAVADGAVLALIASLGLLQLGHETTPELVQLFGVSLLLYALAACPFRGWAPRVAVLVALPVVAASGAPLLAAALGAAAVVLCLRSSYAPTRGFAAWAAVSTLLAALILLGLGAGSSRLEPYRSVDEALSTLRLLAWFTWPCLPLALLTLWRWRAQIDKRHIAVPLLGVLIVLAAFLAARGSDRTLLLALPGLAVLAAFALPTLKRGFTAAVDWFSVFFFSVSALVIWVIYLAMQTGWPSQPAANVRRLAPGFLPAFSPVELAVGALATVAWLGLVRWRVGRHQHPLWKSMVLPASGVALCWTLLMSLWLPLLDHARSHRPLVQRIEPHIVAGRCIWAPGAPKSLVAALEHARSERVYALDESAARACATRLQVRSRLAHRDRADRIGPGWEFVARAQHPSDRDGWVLVYRRSASSP